MKILIKNKTKIKDFTVHLLVCIAVYFCITSCNADINDVHRNYKGYVVIDKYFPKGNLGDNYIILENPDTKEIKKIVLEKTYGNIYEIGETIK